MLNKALRALQTKSPSSETNLFQKWLDFLMFANDEAGTRELLIYGASALKKGLIIDEKYV